MLQEAPQTSSSSSYQLMVASASPTTVVVVRVSLPCRLDIIDDTMELAKPLIPNYDQLPELQLRILSLRDPQFPNQSYPKVSILLVQHVHARCQQAPP